MTRIVVSTTRAVALALTLSVATFAVTPTAHAETAAESEARRLTVEAKAAFDSGRFQAAADLLNRAYAVKPSATLLYNLGRAYQQAGDKQNAIDAYRRYLATESARPDEGAIRRTVDQLEGELVREQALAEDAKRERARADREARAKTEAEERAQHKPSALPWIVGGVGVSGVVAGAVLGGLAASEHDAAVAAPFAHTAETAQSTATTLATVANVAFIAGGALALTGLVWGIFDMRAAASWKKRTALTFGPSFLGLRGEL